MSKASYALYCSMKGLNIARDPQRYCQAGMSGKSGQDTDGEPTGSFLWTPWKLCRAKPICLRLLVQLIRRAASRAA